MTRGSAVRTRILIILVIVGLAVLPAASTLAQEPLRVWHAMGSDSGAVLADAVADFGAQAGVPVEVQAVDPPLLFETTMKSAAGGNGPDALIAGDAAAAGLIENAALASVDTSGPFYLKDLLSNLPDLIDQRCGNQAVIDCLWPGATTALPIATPDAKSVQRALDWLCENPDRLPFCPGGTQPGAPLTWGFTIYLFNGDWLAENGLEPPVNVKAALALRSDYTLSFAQASANRVPQAGDVAPNVIVTIPSTVFATQPETVLRSLGSFFDAGYVAVVGVETGSVYVLSGANNAAQASAFARFMAGNGEVKAALLSNAGLLPAFTSGDLADWGLKTDEARAVLGGLVLLVTYAQLAY